MKLPGISYGPVQSLGRQDVGGELQKGQAVAGVLKMAASVAGDIYEKQSVTQAEKALLEYDTGMTEWAINQTPYQEDGTGTWLKGDELYDKANDANRKAASQELQTPMAKAIFDRKAAQYDADNKIKWGASQLKWMREDQSATALKAYDDYKNMGQWQKAREVIDREVTIGNMSATDGQRKLIETNYLENYYQYSDAVDGVWNAQTGSQTIEAINADKRLDERDKHTLVKATEDKMLQATTDEVFTKMSAVAGELGLPDAIAVGEMMFNDLRDTKAAGLGSDENFKLATLGRVNQIINTFKTQMAKMTTEDKRLIAANRVASGEDPANENINHQAYNDWYASQELGWQFDGKSSYTRTTPQSDIYNDPELRQNSLDFIAGYGVIPKTFDEAVVAALRANNGKDGMNAVMTVYGVSQASPDALFKHGNHEMDAIASMASVNGGSELAFQLAWESHVKVRGMSDDEKKTFYNAETFNDEFEKNFDDVLESNYDVNNPLWAFWRSSTPEVKANYVQRIKTSAKSFLPYSDGNTVAAMNMAMYAMKPAFAVTRVNGDGTPELADRPPEKFVPHGDYNGGEWLRNQTITDLSNAYGPEYDLNYIRVEPAPRFNNNDPAYVIYDHNPDLGFVRQLSVEKYDFSLTPEFAAQQAEAELQARLNASEAERQRNAMKWQLEKNPENKSVPSRRGSRKIKNPYGSLPGAGNKGQLAQRVGKSAEQMGARLFERDQAYIDSIKNLFIAKQSVDKGKRKGRNR